MIKTDNWLSEFFGRKIVQVKVPADDFNRILQLQRQGFDFVEGEVEFELDFEKPMKKITACTKCHIAQAEDIEALKSLFVFPDSRFRPPYFSVEENRHFYQTWITKAVKGEFDNVCLIKRNELGQLQGGITIRLGDNQQAKIGLLAVAPEFRRQGIGMRLLKAAVIWAKQQNIQKLSIATQTNNLKAIRLYQRFGAEFQAVYYWFYQIFPDSSFTKRD